MKRNYRREYLERRKQLYDMHRDWFRYNPVQRA